MFGKRLLLCAFALGLTVTSFAGSADAGGFGIFRRITPKRTVTAPRTIWTQRTTTRTWSAPSSQRITGRHDWPGAIGAPSYRYQIFQDVNGYWK